MNVRSCGRCSYERSCRCRSTPERRIHPPDSSPSSGTCPAPPPPASAAAVPGDEAPLTSSSEHEPPLYGSAALLHRGIYASVRIRASRQPPRPAAAAAAATGVTATPEVVTVLPAGGSARCKCVGGDDGRRTLPPCRRRFCRGTDNCVHSAEAPSHASLLFAGGRGPCDAAGSSKTRSLIVVARPPALNAGCPECHPVTVLSNAADQNTSTEQHRNYGTVTTTTA